jgi:hypothetical protein
MDPITDTIVCTVMIISLFPNIILQGTTIRREITALGVPEEFFKPRKWYANWAYRILEGPNSNLASAFIFIIPIIISAIWIRFWVLVPSFLSFEYGSIAFWVLFVHFFSIGVRLILVRRTKRIVQDKQL